MSAIDFFFLEKRQCLVVYILNKTQMTKETLYISQHDSAVQYHGFTLSMVKKTFKVVVFHFF